MVFYREVVSDTPENVRSVADAIIEVVHLYDLMLALEQAKPKTQIIHFNGHHFSKKEVEEFIKELLNE